MSDEILPCYPFSSHGDQLAPELSDLQAHCPVARVRTNSGNEAWLVTSYELSRRVLRDRKFARAVLADTDSPVQDGPILAPELLGAMDHLRQAGLRDEVLRALGRDQPELPDHWVAKITRAGLGTMACAGSPGDLQRWFAKWVAAQCMCRVLGLPFADNEWLSVRADLDLTMVTPTQDELARNWSEIHDYMHDHMVARRPGRPRGLIDRLADLNDRHRQLDDTQLANIVAVLFVSGYEDFASFLGVAALNLFQHPDIMATLRDHPEDIPKCVEELLRCSVVLGNAIPRMATEDDELGTTDVEKGDLILLSLDAVNFDPKAFSHPSIFDPARSPNPHMRFGFGRHHCPGAHLVRRQSVTAFHVLLDQLPSARLAAPVDQIRWHPNRMAIMPVEVPIEW